MSGIDACRAIRSAHPQVRVLMFTSFGEEEAVTASIMAGASGYLLKNMGRADLLKAIRGVAGGQSLLDPSVTTKVMERLARLATKEEERAVEALSGREREVLALVAGGLTNREIGDKLVITVKTRLATTSAASWRNSASPVEARPRPSLPSMGYSRSSPALAELGGLPSTSP